MIPVVNGYVCSGSCDVEAAKKGKDPNAPPGASPGSSSKIDKTSGFENQPVTVLGGVLADSSTSSVVTVAANTEHSTGSQPPSVNLLV